MSDVRATTLSIRQLSDAVAKAVENERLLQENFVIDSNIIMGRWLRQDVSLKEAEALATRITTAVQQGNGAAGPGAAALSTGAKLQPAVLSIRGRIICGFFPDAPTELGL
jgi:hypothetical protein